MFGVQYLSQRPDVQSPISLRLLRKVPSCIELLVKKKKGKKTKKKKKKRCTALAQGNSRNLLACHS